ncbi:MAG: hypothetical protein IKX87_07825 [Lachnospiraceae bacterium]|nr:hypothetical protein [Lachnospiraceae bacterium]
MSKKVYEGQLDFLGLLNEYTDSQGATVRVREPGNSRLKPVDKSGSKFKVSEAEPEQLTLDLGDMTEAAPVTEVKVETSPVALDAEPIREEFKPIVAEPKKTAEKPEPVVEELKPVEEASKPAKAKDKPKAKSVKEKAKPVEEEPKPEPAIEPVRPAEPEPKADKGGPKEILFKQCKKCWCFDCKHNSRNEGVPRDICGTSMPCPACEGCISEDQATICEIGNAKEGCKLRAKEEGILIEEEPV